MKYDIESIKKRKRIQSILKKVLNIILIILIYNIILLWISYINKIGEIELLGYRAYSITTNSMEPSISSGDVVIVKKYDEDQMRVGNVITYKQKEEIITHRIVDIKETEGEKRFITKGDNNNVEDTEGTQYKDIKGTIILTIPHLGSIIRVLENKMIFLVVVLIFLILLFYRLQLQEKKEIRREKKINEEKTYRE